MVTLIHSIFPAAACSLLLLQSGGAMEYSPSPSWSKQPSPPTGHAAGRIPSAEPSFSAYPTPSANSSSPVASSNDGQTLQPAPTSYPTGYTAEPSLPAYPTPTRQDSGTPEPSLSAYPTPTRQDSGTPEPSLSAYPTPMRQDSGTPEPSLSAYPTPTRQDSGTPEPSLSAYPTPTKQDSGTPEPSLSAYPTPTKQDSGTPEPSFSAYPTPTRQDSGNLCEPGTCGDCNLEKETPGCACKDCEAMVCHYDSFCCEDEGSWDTLCVLWANKHCPDCGSQPSCGESCGDCNAKFSASSSGCSCEDCQEAICSSIDSYCCETEWTGLCTFYASLFCKCFKDEDGCNFESCGNCETANPNELPGCSCRTCQDVVCKHDPFCCGEDSGHWDVNCAATAQNLCTCGNPPPSFTTGNRMLRDLRETVYKNKH